MAMQIVQTQQRMKPPGPRNLERIDEELEELYIRLDAVIESVQLLVPQHYSPPWSQSRLAAELHRARHT